MSSNRNETTRLLRHAGGWSTAKAVDALSSMLAERHRRRSPGRRLVLLERIPAR